MVPVQLSQYLAEVVRNSGCNSKWCCFTVLLEAPLLKFLGCLHKQLLQLIYITSIYVSMSLYFTYFGSSLASLHSCSLNRSSIKCRTNHFRSTEQCSLSRIISLQRDITFCSSSSVASYIKQIKASIHYMWRTSFVRNVAAATKQLLDFLSNIWILCKAGKHI